MDVLANGNTGGGGKDLFLTIISGSAQVCPIIELDYVRRGKDYDRRIIGTDKEMKK